LLVAAKVAGSDDGIDGKVDDVLMNVHDTLSKGLIARERGVSDDMPVSSDIV
jgi:hypothetical protein